MIGSLRSWIICVAGTALISSVAMALAPEGMGKKAVKVVCGFAAVLALLSIVVDFDYRGYSAILAAYRSQSDDTVAQALEESSHQTRFIIEEECEAYILDKAAELEIDVMEVSVTAKWSDSGIWYPAEVELNGDRDSAEEDELTAFIESELGIPAEDQTWSAEDDRT